MTHTLAEALALRPNDHQAVRTAFETRMGVAWHAPTAAHLAQGRPVTVVIPARNTGHAIGPCLDAIAAQDTNGAVEVIVVDDGSSDDTAHIAAVHPAVDILIRLPAPSGAAAARNVGTHLASSETIVYLDADMVMPPHALADFAARAQEQLVLTGFRHNVPYSLRAEGGPHVPAHPANLAADHRVTWRSSGGRQLYSGRVLDGPVTGSPLDDTEDFQQLGYGAFYLDWDLARTVVTAALCVPREAVLEVGGFDETFGRIGWGMEDTHLGAALIAAGCLVAPLRQTVGYHLDPPDAEEQWQTKLAGWSKTLAYYRQLLQAPVPSGRQASFGQRTDVLLKDARVTTR
ncbi:glycosyltransferase [Streptomyces nojiriensis]|uniref:glycosyltransferase n=1 Tax=Streptomyces nojiriensis TaxID=66374 RepID=UPI0035D924BD